MPFDPVSWAAGWGLGKLGDKVIKLLTPSELSTRLGTTAQSWADDLPADRLVAPAAIFALNDTAMGPARRLLFERLIDSRVPTVEEWYKALMERWIAVKGQGGDLQPFFNLPESTASKHLRELAERLETVCLGDERMYRTATAGLGRRITDWQQTGPVMFITDILEPQEYSTAYRVDFYFHNAGGGPVMIYGLSVDIIEISENPTGRALFAGAPVNEYKFAIYLRPEVGRKPLVALGPRRFSLKEEETEFFNAAVTAVPGTDYRLRLCGSVRDLTTNTISEATTPDFWLNFEARL